MKTLAVLGLAVLGLAGCGDCEDVGCSHPLSLLIMFPEGDRPENDVLSIEVEYDDERRSVVCTPDVPCVVSCGAAPCEESDRDVEVSPNSKSIELSLGHMSTRASDGESSCRGAKRVVIDVRRGEQLFETLGLELEYEHNTEYGGPKCGYADQGESMSVVLTPA